MRSARDAGVTKTIEPYSRATDTGDEGLVCWPCGGVDGVDHSRGGEAPM